MSDTLQPMDCGPPGCSVRGILQEGIPERVAIPSPGLTSIYMDHFYISDTILLSLSAPCNFYFCCGSRFWFSDSNDLSHPTLGPFSHTPWLFFHLKSSCSFSFSCPSPLPSFYFISSSLSPSIFISLLQMDEELLELTVLFLKMSYMILQNGSLRVCCQKNTLGR